ncbi:MAG: hypothetical protein NVSMB22_19890 [Chloroflexota bacterium]
MLAPILLYRLAAPVASCIRTNFALVLLAISVTLLYGCSSEQQVALPASPVPTAPPGSGESAGVLEIEPHGERAVVKAIDRAQHDVFMEMYILTDRGVVRALQRAVAQNVRVWVLLEHRPFGMGTQPERITRQLRAAGIFVRWSPPGFALTHAKYLVIDDALALISTANFSRSGFHTDRDFVFFDRDPRVLRELSSLFRWDWNQRRASLHDSNLVIAPDNARARLEALIRLATRSLDLYAEEMNDPQIERILLAARSRGVRVRLLLPAGASLQAAAALTRGGVAVRRPKSPYIHAKAAIVDRRIAYVGSENFSTASLDRNREVGVIVSRQIALQLERRFRADWASSPR